MDSSLDFWVAEGLDKVRASPLDFGTVELIALRPRPGQRRVAMSAVLDVDRGVIGDGWNRRSRSRSFGTQPDPKRRQVALVNSRAMALIEPDPARRPLVGDQLHVDLALGRAQLPVGTQLGVGSAVIEITSASHTGCSKFSARFGAEMLDLVNSPAGRALGLRGAFARVVVAGTVTIGDTIRRL